MFYIVRSIAILRKVQTPKQR